MARPSLPLNALRAFEAAARHLSFTRAADELNVTQAAVSHQVKGLEARLGIKLFRRLPRALRLTDEGQALLPELGAAFAHIAEALDRIGNAARATLTVSLNTTFALAWLVPRLPRFQQACPDIELQLMTTNRVVDFFREDVDAAVRWGTGEWPGLRADRLFDDNFLTPLCGRAHRHRLNRPDDLKQVPLLQVQDDSDWAIWLPAAGVYGIDATKGSEFDSTSNAVRAAIDGLGVAIAAPFLFADDIAAGRLFQPFSLTVGNGRAYWLVSPAATAERPKLREFRAWILEEAAASPHRNG